MNFDSANHTIPLRVKTVLHEVEKHAREFPGSEVCGLVIDGEVVRGNNVLDAVARAGRFQLDQNTFSLVSPALQAGKQVIVYHSHSAPEALSDFSPEDMAAIYEDGELPWLLVDARGSTAEYKYFDPLAKLDYEGREWRWSCCNCYTLIRDWLSRELSIQLDPFILESHEAWLNPDWNEFLLNIEAQGFILVDSPPDIKNVKTGDLVLFRVGRAKNPNHIGIITNAAKNELLHQLQDAPSAVVPYSFSKRKSTVGIYRHSSRMEAV